MTTIAIDRDIGLVSYDSRITNGHEIVYNCPKVWFSETHPVIYAGAGSITSMHHIGHYLDHCKKLPWEDDKWFDCGMNKGVDDASLGIIHPDGRVYVFEFPHYYPITGRYVTLGSGGQAAHAAMLCGKSPPEAVEIACQVDAGSGLPVHTLMLADIPTPPSRKRPHGKKASARPGSEP